MYGISSAEILETYHGQLLFLFIRFVLGISPKSENKCGMFGQEAILIIIAIRKMNTAYFLSIYFISTIHKF